MVRIVHCRKEPGVLRNNERSSLAPCTACGDAVVKMERFALLAAEVY